MTEPNDDDVLMLEEAFRDFPVQELYRLRLGLKTIWREGVRAKNINYAAWLEKRISILTKLVIRKTLEEVNVDEDTTEFEDEIYQATRLKMKADRGCRGFTLTELVILVAMIAVLAAIVVPAALEYIRDGQLAQEGVVVEEELVINEDELIYRRGGE